MRNDGLTVNLLFLVSVVTFGTWFPLAYNIVALNGPQLVVVTWIRSVGCSRISNTSSIFTDVNETHSQWQLWCSEFIAESGDEVGEMLAENHTLNAVWALTSALFSLGGLISALTSGPLIHRYGLKISILINAAILVGGTGVCCLSPVAHSFEMLIVGRIIVGFAVGSGCVLTPMYTAELTPVALRGALGTLPTTMFVLGMIAATVMGLPFVLGNSWGWPILLTLHLLPVGLMCVVLPFCPESPRHLFLRRGEKVAAEQALVWLRGTTDVQEELAVIQEEAEKDSTRDRVSIVGLLRSPFLRSTLWLAAVPMTALHFSGYSCLSFYSTAIFSAAGLTRLNSIYASLGLWCIFLLVNLVSLTLVDRSGRRILLLISHAGTLIGLCFLVLTMALTRHQGYEWTKYGSVASIFFFIVSHGVALFSVPWILGAELFTQEARAAAMTLISVVCWVTELMATLIFPLIIAAAQEYTFIIFIGFVALTGLFTYWKVPETKGKTIKQIQDLLRPPNCK
ncbi:Solute carrier family 2, facilitated glucose transporter member 1 [Hypsibius exemplaris]|uniref:Solute carrier family 2, facilitated glucose transporter member 1 n=1 Tax=Hypsibius exemplaris TaxID=2072580 RepID=A0A9X6RLK6_HYPEX|nr:Solute carrier family 2, facilitated glucose transporter member 1 [Hypsibius exemplaris]